MKEPTVRVRWLEKWEAELLLSNIKVKWMKDFVSIAILTGMRKSEILSLKWKSVDLVRRVAHVTADNAKSGRARPVPLNDVAIEILNGIEKMVTMYFPTKESEGVTIIVNAITKHWMILA